MNDFPIIGIKSGIKQLELFVNSEFKYFEAYTNYNDDLTQLLNTDMVMYAIHMPNSISVDNSLVSFDLLADNSAAKYSIELLDKIISFSIDNKVPNIILHAGFYNDLITDNNEAISNLANILDKYKNIPVTICLENVPAWINQYGYKQPIISTYKHLIKINEMLPHIGSVIDVDHLAINTIFESYISTKSYHAMNKNIMETDYLKYAQRNIKKLTALINDEISCAFNNHTPTIIHAVGSDFLNYFYYNQLPLIGEGLPLNYNEYINMFLVNDKIEHTRWINKCNSVKYITMELILRENDYSYINELERNHKIIIKLLNKSI